jgi:hypothetical protein
MAQAEQLARLAGPLKAGGRTATRQNYEIFRLHFR